MCAYEDIMCCLALSSTIVPIFMQFTHKIRSCIIKMGTHARRRFVVEGASELLPVHNLKETEPYYLSLFLGGVYQVHTSTVLRKI